MDEKLLLVATRWHIHDREPGWSATALGGIFLGLAGGLEKQGTATLVDACSIVPLLTGHDVPSSAAVIASQRREVYQLIHNAASHEVQDEIIHILSPHNLF